MNDDGSTREQLEARRELLREAIADLPNATDPDQAAGEVMRALDAYIETAAPSALAPREAPVADYRRAARDHGGEDLRWARWLVLGGGVLCTVVVAVVLQGGWPAGLAIIAIWAVALFALTST